jgi:hypothetical protein
MANNDIHSTVASASQLKWYLPISANVSFGFLPADHYLIVTTPYTMAGIDLVQGGYMYNNTIKEEMKCAKVIDDYIVTVGVEHVGKWDIENGTAIEWFKLPTIESKVSTCSIISPSNDHIIVHYGNQILSLDQKWNTTWTWKPEHGLISSIEYSDDNIVVVGHDGDELMVFQLGLENGVASDPIPSTKLGTNVPEISIMGEHVQFLVWLDDSNHVRGFAIDHEIILDFHVLFNLFRM